MKKPIPISCRLIKNLIDEHKVILQGLGVLRIVTERIAKRRPVALRDLRYLVRFFEVYADNIHHHAEENLLFEALAGTAPRSLRRMMEQLITQHVMGRFFVFRISEAVSGAATGIRGWRKKFVESAQAYDTLLSCHICSEDHHVFPIADQLVRKRSVKLRSEAQLTLKLKSRLEKSLNRIATKYGGVGDIAIRAEQCERERDS